MISLEESYDCFTTTLSRFCKEKLNLRDDYLAYEIFEELDVESNSFMHEWTVDRLIEGGLIPGYLKERILKLRESIRDLMESKHSVKQYREDTEWAAVRNEANGITEIIKTFANKS